MVHHAVHAVIAPLFERGFIDHTYANRAGKGTHRALARYERLRDRHRYVLRGDIYRYFPAIDHEVLKADLRRRIACRQTLAVLDRIVDASNPQEPVNLYYPGDDLFTPFERRRGLPIGNLTSQLFANVYLDRFDHFVTEVLRAPYLRYADDFALFADDPAGLEAWRGRQPVGRLPFVLKRLQALPHGLDLVLRQVVVVQHHPYVLDEPSQVPDLAQGRVVPLAGRDLAACLGDGADTADGLRCRLLETPQGLVARREQPFGRRALGRVDFGLPQQPPEGGPRRRDLHAGKLSRSRASSTFSRRLSIVQQVLAMRSACSSSRTRAARVAESFWTSLRR